MSPVCRDETLAGLKIKKRILGGNMLMYRFDTNVKFMLYATNFPLKKHYPQMTYFAEEYSFSRYFCVK